MAKGCSFPYLFFFFFSWLKCKIDPLHFTFCHVSTLTLVSVNSVFKFQKCFNSGLPLTSVNAQPLGVWIHVCYVLCFCVFPFFFFFTPFPPTGGTVHVQYMNSSHNFWPFFHEQYIRALFTDPQISFFINFFIKNESHSTIHTFKNYFVTVFSVFSFQFQQNKFYPNRF